MDDTIFETVEEYLMLQKTNYAIQINGPWGVGKTYYVTQVLKQRIENIDVFEENPKEGKYKFIYVSLNGLRSVDEIGESVFLGSINKYGSGTYKLTKIGLGIGAKIPGWKILEKADEGMNTITKFSKHLKKCILCFDDLERIDKSVSIQQVLGYINSTYIEHENIKTLFISNEEKMNENKDFYKIKEKVIGRTIQYDKKLKEVLPDFMQNNYGDNENVNQFYTENSDTILQIISYVNEKINLRTLGFVFDSFTQVMSKCKTIIKHNNEMYLSVFTNILLISNDYKEGELNRIEELEPLYDLIQLSFFIEFDNKKESSDLDYGSRFWYRYFKKQTIMRGFVHVYKSISEYILTGHLNVALLESEIKAKYSQEEEKLEDKALRIVENYIDYELDQINNSLQTLIEGIEKGYYTPDRYPRLYRLLFELNKRGLIEINLDELYKVCNVGLEKAIESHGLEGENSFEYHQDKWGVDKKYERLISRIREARMEKQRKKESDVLDGFFKSIKEANMDEFRAYYTTIIHEKNFFNIINQEAICDDIILFPNKGLNLFYGFLRERYLKISNAKDFYRHEVDFIKAFSQGISKRLNKEGIDVLKKSILLDLIQLLEKIEKHISEDIDE